MGLDLGAALSNLANKISGGGSGDGGANNVGATGGASGASGGGRVNSYQANNAAETAIGEQLSGNKYEAESAKTIEEKASAALDELMSSLGLAAGDADEALTEMSSAIETEIETREAEEAKELEDTVEETKVEETEETELDPEVQGILDGMSDEELDALKKAIEEEQKDREFTDEEAATFAAGEEEVQARVKEAIENNPDMDPAEIEATIREAYELENPEYAAAAEEAAKVLEEHNAAMDEAYAAYQEENPMPNEADYSNPTEYLAAMNEWTAAAEEHMNEQEAKYREENENYDNLMDAVEWENKNDIFERIKEKLKEPGFLSGIAEGASTGILSGIAEGAGSGALSGITGSKLDDIAKEMLENTEKYMQENELTLEDSVERSGDQTIIDMINDGFLPPDFGAGVSDVEIAAYRHWKEQQ